jgi:hypothetical protein
MTQDVDLKQMERKAWTAYFHDGLTDLYGGFILLGFGLSMLTGQIWWIALMLVGTALLWARKRITYPRMGHVRFSPQRQARTKRSRLLAGIAIAGTFLLGAVLFALVWTGGLPQWLEAWLTDYLLVALAVLVGALIAIGAYLMRVARFYAYAVLVFAAFAVGQWLNTSAGLPVTIAAGVILLCGLVVLMRFVRKYPLPTQEEPDDNR